MSKNNLPESESLTATVNSSAAATLSQDLNLSVAVYRELEDSPVKKINLIELIESQFKQLEVLNQRKSYLLKEVSHYIVK